MQLERFGRIAALGGVYSNHIALETAIADARNRKNVVVRAFVFF